MHVNQIGKRTVRAFRLSSARNQIHKIPNVQPFVHSTNSGAFIVEDAANVTRTSTSVRSQLTIDIINQKARHEEREKLYWAMQAIEQALYNQIIITVKRNV